MKRIFLFLAVVSITVHAAAFEFGLDMTNSHELSGEDKTLNLFDNHRLSSFLQTPMGSSGSLYLSASIGSYALFRFYPKANTVWQPLSQVLKITRTDWSGAVAFNKIGMKWAIGRTNFNDYSDKILRGLFDGGRIKFTIKHANLGFAAGYTGLTHKGDAKVRIDADDMEQLASSDEILAPQRIFLLGSASFQNLIPAHTFGVDMLAQFDLAELKKRTHTQYVIPYIYGRITSNLSWKYWAAIELGQDPDFFYSLASGVSLTYFNPHWRSFTLTGLADWAAGDYDGAGRVRAFIPITDTKHTRIANVRYRNMLTAGLTASVLPIRGLKTELSYLAVLEPNTNKKPMYTGSEIAGKISHQLNSDVEASLTGGVFIADKKVTGYTIRWLAELSCTMHL